MIFHTIHTISIRRYSIMDATQNIKLVAKIPYPWCRKAFERLQVEVGLLFNKDILDKDILRIIMYNRITLYRAAFIILSYHSNPEIEQWYKDYFGGDFDAKLLSNEIDRLEHRYKELERKEPTSDSSFEDLISGVEVMLGYSIDRKNTLFEFKALYDMAIKKTKNG